MKLLFFFSVKYSDVFELNISEIYYLYMVIHTGLVECLTVYQGRDDKLR